MDSTKHYLCKMCGIVGVISFTEHGNKTLANIDAAVACLNNRGPDSSGIFRDEHVVLGHTRLAIIDASQTGNQPMTDSSGRYTIIFNGEFFNFKEHRDFVLSKGYKLKSTSDTEVLLYLYMIEGSECLRRVNGFFAFAIYDKLEQTVFIARDRIGVKPLYWYHDDDRIIFGSEMKALLNLGIRKEVDEVSLFTYFQLNYIPAPHSIFNGVAKLMPGHFLKLTIRDSKFEIQSYYEVPKPNGAILNLNYDEAKNKLYELLETSVERRLISDVPLGSFLSGGIDSSIVSALAAQHTKHLKTFSIGFSDEPFFDETKYANLVAKKIGSDHTVFSLTNNDLFSHLYDVLNYIDEPFADSSSLNVYILSMYTRKHVTVALSGDGADELFGGYHKHEAERRALKGGVINELIKAGNLIWKSLPKSRHNKYGNTVRQLYRFSEGLKVNAKERYWQWACVASESEVANILAESNFSDTNAKEFVNRKKNILKFIEGKNLNEIFFTDVHLPLANDMLTKVDMMSMANSLEVRNPFLDYTIVNYAFSLPVEYKISREGRKRVLRDAFRHLLPDELYARKKQGFEVPLLKWFQTDLKSVIIDDLLSKSFIQNQGIFNYNGIVELQKRLFSKNPGDAVATTWALIVFQYWWKKYFA
jgi:asparagine synthase (glutamine-hydrolysing)